MAYDKSRFLLLLKKASGESKAEVKRRVHENDIADLKSDIASRSYSLGSNEVNFLKRYKNTLEKHEENAKKIKRIEENYSEIENIFDTLKNEVDHAFDESVELEHIAQALNDKELIRRSKHDESAVESLREKLKHMIKMKNEMEKREAKLESPTEHFDDIEHALKLRIELIGTIVSEADTGGGPSLTEPWRLIAKDPKDEPDDWSVASSDRWIEDWKWGGASYSWMSRGAVKSDQGWKIHVATDADNKSEVFQVVKAILPVLNDMKGERKFGRSAESMKNDIPASARMKISTIYPDPDDIPSDRVNQNKKRTQSIVGRLITALQSEGLLKMTKPVTTIGEFNVQVKGTPTRIFVRYDTLGGSKIVDKDWNDFGGRKSGAVPEGFEAKLGKSISGEDIRELPGLQSPSFQISLPSSNFNK